jgi:dolichol-phosphate mannosyltransferase
VRKAFLLVRERRRAYRQIVDWLGFKRESVVFDAGERHEGKPTYSLSKLWDLALDMIISRSSVPLRLLLYLGFLISLASSVSLVWMFVANDWVDKRWYYTPLAKALVFNTLLIGVVLTALGIVGLYVGRIHEEVRARPLFTVRATMNLPDDET